MRRARSGWVGAGAVLVAAVGACGGAKPPPVVPAKPIATQASVRAESCARQHPGTGATRFDARRQGGPLTLARGEGRTIAYIADADDDALLALDAANGRALSRTPLGGSPAEVLVLADGRVAVTLRDKNRVALYEPEADDRPLAALCSVATAVEPLGLAATPDDARLVVTSGFGNRLAVFDAADMKRVLDKKVAREPRSVLVDGDGKRAFVAHVVGGKVSVVDLDDGDAPAREIDLRVDRSFQFGAAGGTRQSCQGFALASVVDGPAPRGRVFAPRVTVEPGDPTRMSSGYGNSAVARMETPIVSVIDAAAERSMTMAVTDATVVQGALPKEECLLPRAAAVSAGGTLLVTCLGSDTLVEMDARGLDPAGLERRKWRVAAGPVGLAVDDRAGRALVWSQFDRRLSAVELADKGATRAWDAPAPRKGKLSAQAALGRKVFHRTDDARISQDGRACASCHPDGREDALTWPTPVGPRQTLMLAGRLASTAPYSWLGAHATLKVHLRNTFERLGGSGLPDEAGSDDELDALIAYLTAMPAPKLDGAAPNDSSRLAAHGKELFYSAARGCSSCHTGGSGTDAHGHDLDAAVENPANTFDTPSLRFVSGTAPYFHDGRYATLMDLLTSTDSKMGHTLDLSRRDAAALAAYLETL